MKELDSFTVDRLEGFIGDAETWSFVKIPSRELNSLARIALAAKRAEPVAWTSQRSLDTKNKIVAFTDDMSALDYGTANGWADIVELYTTPQLNSPEIPDGWKIGKFGYQDLFNAIGAAVSSPHAGGFSISVKAFEEAMLAAAPEKPL
ncbi:MULTISPECIES: hypothetical protein [Yersinia]|uniref:hypothetical protein n=1 Tax=Yersinia TaxID=629 RepID=UPI000EAD2D07|nr:hypothetical protein [Yersinia sp. IP36721]